MNDAPATRDGNRAGGEWMSDTMRVTFFVPAPREWPEALLEKLVGHPADLLQTSKRVGLPTKLEAVKLGSHQVNAVAGPVRLDVHVSVVATPEEADTIVRSASQFRDLLTKIADNASGFAPFGRLGVGASLIRPCGNKADVYRNIQARFPCLELDHTNSDDFLLQLNRYIDDPQEGRINRIERWSYGLFERFEFPVMGRVPEFGKVGQRLEGVKMDLDFNTAANGSEIFDADASKRVVACLIDAIFTKMQAE
jgi:hypothetical protein